MTNISKSSRARLHKATRFVAVIALGGMASGLAGCGAMIADLPLVGLPADAPPRKEKGSFIPVNDLPGQRDTAKMETAEQVRLRAELAAERDRQTAAAAAVGK